MQEFSVLMEGLESEGKGYFINFEVIASSEARAVEITLNSAKVMGLTNLSIEEISKGDFVTSKDEKILKVSGKSYFPT